MTKISFGLVRSKNPDVAVTENIEEIDAIDLSGCNIDELENLEVFSHIKELNISNNKLKSFGEINLFSKLQILDFSNNLLDAQELKKSIKLLPRTILSINLSGNPCAEDEEILGELQDSLPELVIAIEAQSEEQYQAERVATSHGRRKDIYPLEEEKAKEGEEDEDDDENVENQSYESNYTGPLNSDEVLKMIVERKCKLQSLSQFNLDAAVMDLNKEMDKAMQHVSSRKARIPKDDDCDVISDTIKERTKAMMERSQAQHTTSYDTVLERIRTSALQKLQEIHTMHHDQLSVEATAKRSLVETKDEK